MTGAHSCGAPHSPAWLRDPSVRSSAPAVPAHLERRRAEAETPPKSSARTRTTNSCSSTTSRRTPSSPRRSTARPTPASCSARSYQWTGSENSNVSQMVNAVNSAVTSGADGIAVALIDLHAFNAPVEAAIKAGIPVVAYNADAPGNARLAYIGQDLFKAGEEMGKRIVAAVGSGEVALFIATPGSANLQPRIEGAEKAIKDSGKPITTHAVATGAAVTQEQPAIEAWYLSSQKREGHVRRRRRQHGKPRQSHAEARSRIQGRSRRRLRPDRTDAEAAAGRQHRIHDRPAALPSGLPADPGALPLQGLRAR